MLTHKPHPPRLVSPRCAQHGDGQRGELPAPTACPQAPGTCAPAPTLPSHSIVPQSPAHPTPQPHTPGNSLVMHTSSCPALLSTHRDLLRGSPCTHPSLPACAAMGLLWSSDFLPSSSAGGGLQQHRGGSRGRHLSPSSVTSKLCDLGGGPFSPLSVLPHLQKGAVIRPALTISLARPWWNPGKHGTRGVL